MSYTELDWLRDLMSAPNVDIGKHGVLELWMREGGRAIVRRDEHAALIQHVMRRRHDHDLCEMADIHWQKEAIDWERD